MRMIYLLSSKYTRLPAFATIDSAFTLYKERPNPQLIQWVPSLRMSSWTSYNHALFFYFNNFLLSTVRSFIWYSTSLKSNYLKTHTYTFFWPFQSSKNCPISICFYSKTFWVILNYFLHSLHSFLSSPQWDLWSCYSVDTGLIRSCDLHLCTANAQFLIYTLLGFTAAFDILTIPSVFNHFLLKTSVIPHSLDFHTSTSLTTTS